MVEEQKVSEGPEELSDTARAEQEHRNRVVKALAVTAGILMVVALVTGLLGEAICIGPLILYIVYRVVYDKQDLVDRRKHWTRRRR